MGSAMVADDSNTELRGSSPNLVAGVAIGIFLAIGAIVWAGGLSFSNDEVASPNPAQQANGTNPSAQMPIRSTTGSR